MNVGHWRKFVHIKVFVGRELHKYDLYFNLSFVFVQLYVGVTLLHCCHLFQIKHHKSVLGVGCCVGTAQVI